MASLIEPPPATAIAAGALEDAPQPRWYQGIDRYAWTVLLIAALGWMFDTFDQHLFNLVRQASVTELLQKSMPSADAATIAAEAGRVGPNLTSVFLLGWATGGFLFGTLGDKLGRTRTMSITIFIYALFTGLNGLVQTMPQYYVCRFLVALGVGGEFAAGAALVAEVWPQRSRAMGLGLLQSLSAVGNIAAALTTLILSAVSWRYVFMVGALPALLIVWIRRSVHEPDAWHQAKAKAAEEGTSSEFGSIPALFRRPEIRRNTFAGILLATAGVGGLWGVGFFSVDLIGQVFPPLIKGAPNIAAINEPRAQEAAVKAALQQWKSVLFLVQMIGAGLGMFSFAALSERIGRRPALGLFFVLAFASVQAFFQGMHGPLSAFLLIFPLGFCTLAPLSAFSIYFPELFPTRLRATGVGFCYNAARIFAAGAPFTLGKLSEVFATGDKAAGLRAAASIVACIYFVGFIGLALAPETRGQALPE